MNRTLLKTALFAGLSAAFVLTPTTSGAQPATAENAKLRMRYVDATVETACESRRFAATEDAKREANNDRILKKHGFTRASFGDAAVQFGADLKANNDVSSRLRRCTDRTGHMEGRYAAKLDKGPLKGEVSLTVRRSSVRGRFTGTAPARSLRISFRGKKPSAQLRLTGHWRDLAYVLTAQPKGKNLQCQLIVVLDDGRRYSSEFVLTRKK